MTRNDYRTVQAARQRSVEKQFIGPIYREIRKQYTDFLNYAARYDLEQAKHNIHSIVGMDGITGVLKRMYKVVAYQEAKRVFSSLIKQGYREKRIGGTPTFGVGFDEIAGTVDGYFKIYQLSKSGIPITQTSIKYIQDHLIAEVEGGRSYEDAVRNFRELALTGTETQSPQSRMRARVIVQTEGTRSLSFGGLIGAYMSGVDVDKEWITSADERVRGARSNAHYPHTVLDRQVTSLFGAFSNGEQIKFPGDPDASKANTINCRCSNIYKQKQRPRPRMTTRRIQNFLTDFFIGFFSGQAAAEILEPETIDDGGI